MCFNILDLKRNYKCINRGLRRNTAKNRVSYMNT